MISFASHSRFYFFIFGCMGLISPYLGWWLNSVVPAHNLKYALMAFNATVIVVPTIWGHWAFANARPGHWLSHGTIVACIFAMGLTQIDQQLPLIVSCFLLMAFGVFFNPILPLLEAMTYQQMKNPQSYSNIRLFGSVGFMVCSFLVGGVILINTPSLFPYLVAALLAVCWCISFPYKAVSTSISVSPVVVVSHEKSASVGKSLKSLHPLWVITCLIQAAFACYYAFFALHLQHIGSGGWVVGALIALGTASEVVAFWKIDWFFKRWSPIALLCTAAALLMLRWGVFAYATSSVLFLIVVLQLTQAVGFSVFHTACLKIIHDKIPTYNQGAAQGFYNAIGYGVGGCIGVFFGGVLWEQYKGMGVFVFAMGLCAVALVWALLWKRGANLKSA